MRGTKDASEMGRMERRRVKRWKKECNEGEERRRKGGKTDMEKE